MPGSRGNSCAKALRQKCAPPFQGSEESQCACKQEEETGAYQSREENSLSDTGDTERGPILWTSRAVKIFCFILGAKEIFFPLGDSVGWECDIKLYDWV